MTGMKKRITALLLTLVLFLCWGSSVFAENVDPTEDAIESGETAAPNTDESGEVADIPEAEGEDSTEAELGHASVDTAAALVRAAELEAEQGKLRSIVVHVRNGEEPVMPKATDSAETAWMKALAAALEARWDLAEEAAGDILTAEARKAYAAAAQAELDALEPYGETTMEDPLMDLLRQAYLETLKQEIAAAETDQDPIAFAWKWTEARQDGIKNLFFLNRYYKVSVRKAYRDKMNSTLYEGALLVSEETVKEIVEKWEETAGTEEAEDPEAEIAAEESKGAEGAEEAEDPEAGTVAEESEEAKETEEPEEPEEAEEPTPAAVEYGPEIWHKDPTGGYEMRIYDFDPETMTIMIDLRAVDNPNRASKGRIDLSQWQKYTEGRFSVGTFYHVDGISVQEEKISFTLHMNVLVDGRLHREVRGKIALKLPTEKSSSSGTATATATEEDANPFDEPTIKQNFYDLEIGDIIKMGYYEQDGDESNLREPIEWKVISLQKKKTVALVVSVYALESRPYGVAGDETEYDRDGLNWKNSDLRAWLNGDFYNQNFTPAEKKRIREASNVTKDPSGRFTTKDKVFLLSAVEAPRYMHTAKGLTCMPTAAVLQKLGEDSPAITKDGSCKWWLREMVRAVKLDRKGNNPKKTYNTAGYVNGSTGMLDYRKKIGLATYEEGQALVRPAMWIKYDTNKKK